MCGLVGVAGKIDNNLEKAFKELLVLDQLRGDHSTGAAFISQKGDIEVVKVMGGATDLLGNTRFIKRLALASKALIGHNRYATIGKQNKSNAHPFEFSSIVGAHNGTLRDYRDLYGYGDFGTDSETLYHHADKYGMEDALSKITGAFALTYYDKDEDRMVFARNTERPLFIAVLENNALVWASEDWMLHVVLRRSHEHKVLNIFELKKDTLVSYDLKDLSFKETKITTKPSTLHHNRYPSTTHNYRKGIRCKIIGKATEGKSSWWTIEEVGKPQNKGRLSVLLTKDIGLGDLLYVDQSYKSSHHMYHSNPRPILVHAPKTETKEATTLQGLIEEVKEEYVVDSPFTDYYGEVISKDEWSRKFSSCCWCTQWVNPELEGHVLISNTDVVCSSCTDTPEVKDYLRSA